MSWSMKCAKICQKENWLIVVKNCNGCSGLRAGISRHESRAGSPLSAGFGKPFGYKGEPAQARRLESVSKSLEWSLLDGSNEFRHWRPGQKQALSSEPVVINRLCRQKPAPAKNWLSDWDEPAASGQGRYTLRQWKWKSFWKALWMLLIRDLKRLNLRWKEFCWFEAKQLPK